MKVGDRVVHNDDPTETGEIIAIDGAGICMTIDDEHGAILSTDAANVTHAADRGWRPLGASDFDLNEDNHHLDIRVGRYLLRVRAVADDDDIVHLYVSEWYGPRPEPQR